MESVDSAEWQSFDVSQFVDPDQYLAQIDVLPTGTGSGVEEFQMLDLRVVGTIIDNPTDVLHVRIFWVAGVELSKVASKHDDRTSNLEFELGSSDNFRSRTIDGCRHGVPDFSPALN